MYSINISTSQEQLYCTSYRINISTCYRAATGQIGPQTTGTAATASGMYPLATAEIQQLPEQIHKLQEQRRQLQEQPPYLKKTMSLAARKCPPDKGTFNPAT